MLPDESIGYVRDLGAPPYPSTEKKRREYGAHLTSIDIFREFILPEIKECLYDFSWVDLFAGEGNLILPILDLIPQEKRADFFREHIFLYDIQPEMVEKAVANAMKYGIPQEIARENIKVRDTLQNYPDFKNLRYPPYHITNPPYLYIGYIVKSSERNLRYFTGPNEGYQDLYQIALMNDLRNGLKHMIYIIPTNFLFGFSVSNKIRRDFLPFYKINKAYIFERKIFEFTGTNVCILFFARKSYPRDEPLIFPAIKINHQRTSRIYRLYPNNSYRAGGEFEEFVAQYRASERLKVKFYLTIEEVERNKGEYKVKLLDANSFSNGLYKFGIYEVNRELYEKLKSNPLFLRTLDTGSWEGRVGIYDVREIFGVDGIVVTKEKYRTHPIQIFLTPELSQEDLSLLRNYFNLMLEHFREITDSEFLTTFKYSTSDYVRKYLGLTQAKKLLETFPLDLSQSEKSLLSSLIEGKDVEGIKQMLLGHKKEGNEIILLFGEIIKALQS
jgi:type I restriction-modification system DNA methylase subunit